MTPREIIAEYAVPSIIGAGVYVVRKMVSSITNFKRDITKELAVLGKRIGYIENRMVHLEGAVHQQGTNSGRPPRPGKY